MAVDGQQHGLLRDDFQTYVRDRPETQMRLTIERAGHPLDLVATSGVQFEKNPAGGVSRLGLMGVEAAVDPPHVQPDRSGGRGGDAKTWSIVAKHRVTTWGE